MPGSSVLVYLQSLLKLMTIQPVISNHLILCHLSPSAFNLSQYQGLFQWISSSHLVAKVLELQLQHQTSNKYSGLISSRIDWFDLVLSKGLSRVFTSTSFQRNQFFITQPSLWSNSYMHIWLLEKPWLWLYRPFVSKVMALLYNALSWFVIALTAKEYAGWNVSIKVQCRKQKPLQVFWAEKI